MRLIIDLTPIQAPGSADRGIGRYSFMLAKSLIERSRGHDVRLVLSADYKDHFDNAKLLAEKIAPSSHITFYETGIKAFQHSQAIEAQNIRSSIYRHHIASLCPDALHVCSLSDGMNKPGLIPTDLKELSPTLSGSTLYDLIPLLFEEQYINKDNKNLFDLFYKQYSKHDLVACISESARKDAIKYIGLREDRAIKIMGDVDKKFKIIQNSREIFQKERKRLGIEKDFVLYTGGFDFRKNLYGLMEAYSMLPENLKNSHQLVIVCKTTYNQNSDLVNYAKKVGIEKSLILTGFVSDNDLVLLKNSCKLFVFPSLYEGFGMPVLEAMRCGAPVIGSNVSSIPEIISREDALFDPTDPKMISESIGAALIDEGYRNSLVESGLKNASKFNWESSADLLWDGYEAVHERKMRELADKPIEVTMVSPMPPDKTGIANYTANFLESVDPKININIVTENGKVESEKNLQIYDEKTIYQFGNSHFHWRMWDKINQNGGILVMHDAYIGGLLNWMEIELSRTGLIKNNIHSSLYINNKINNNFDISYAIENLPLSKNIIESSDGCFVHSDFAKDIIKIHYPNLTRTRIIKIPQIRNCEKKLSSIERKEIRKRLKIDESSPIIISAGFVHQIKLADEMIAAFGKICKIWPQAKFILLGQAAHELSPASNYILKKNARQICITGYLDDESFQNYIACADIAVQFRRFTRGETSRAVLDAMAHGIPLIVNDIGPMGEIDPEAALILKGVPSVEQISESIIKIWKNNKMRIEMSKKARESLNKNNNNKIVSEIFTSGVNRFYSDIEQKDIKNRIDKISKMINNYKIDVNTKILSESILKNSNINNYEYILNKLKFRFNLL